MSDWRTFWIVLVRDPYLVFGLLSLGAPGVAGFYMHRRLREAGLKYKSRLTLPAIWWEARVREYARSRDKFGWPSWPLHLMWLSFVIGIPLLVLGFIKL